MKRLEGKVAIITGASSGIGKTTAALFAREGAKLVLAARRYDRLLETETICSEFGAEVISVKCDVTKPEDCEKVVTAAMDQWGRIDILVNNAGIGDRHRRITHCPEDWWHHVIDTDQNSVYYMCKYVLPHMEKKEYGSIINISSIGGVFGSAGISYSAAKAALLGMTKNIAIQYAGRGIRCNAVCPGPTPTELNTPEQMATFDTWFVEETGRHMDTTRPQATTEDQANAILFFASDESKAITGQNLIVDNGTTL